MLSLIACFWNFSRLKTHRANLFPSENEQGLNGKKDSQDSSHLSNVDKLVKLRTKDIDDEVLYKNYVNILLKCKGTISAAHRKPVI